jgi:hypothetical protein
MCRCHDEESSVFDSLGLIAPFVLKTNIRLQDLLRRQVPYDDELPRDNLHNWERWIFELAPLVDFSISSICVLPTNRRTFIVHYL